MGELLTRIALVGLLLALLAPGVAHAGVPVGLGRFDHVYRPHHYQYDGTHGALNMLQLRGIGEAVGMRPWQAYVWARTVTYESAGTVNVNANPGEQSTYPGDDGIGLNMAAPRAGGWGSGPLGVYFRQLGGYAGQRNPFNAARLALRAYRLGGGSWNSWYTGIRGLDPQYVAALNALRAGFRPRSVLAPAGRRLR